MGISPDQLNYTLQYPSEVGGYPANPFGGYCGGNRIPTLHIHLVHSFICLLYAIDEISAEYMYVGFLGQPIAKTTISDQR